MRHALSSRNSFRSPSRRSLYSLLSSTLPMLAVGEAATGSAAIPATRKAATTSADINHCPRQRATLARKSKQGILAWMVPLADRFTHNQGFGRPRSPDKASPFEQDASPVKQQVPPSFCFSSLQLRWLYPPRQLRRPYARRQKH